MKTYEEMVAEINAYLPVSPLEKVDKELILQYLEAFGEKAFYRNSYAAHMSASSIVFNQNMDKVLFAYHNIYDTYAWLGGHADGDYDLAHVALIETMEESGLKNLKPILLENNPFASLEVLHVRHHKKNKIDVSEHLHLNITYLFEASENDPIRIKEDENSAIRWIKISDLDRFVASKNMLEVYRKIIKKYLG